MALAICDISLRINPDDPIAEENTVESWIGEGKNDQAIAHWQRVVQLNPNGPMGRAANGFLAKYQ